MIIRAVIIVTLVTLCEAASITNNIGDSLRLCPGKDLITLTCTGIGNSQRWNVLKEGVHLAEQVFTSGQHEETQMTVGVYEFTLISTQHYHFVSTLSTAVTNATNNTEVICTDHNIPATVMLRIEVEPSPPENVGIQSVKYHSNDSTVVVAWEPTSNDSRIDFYQYEVIDNITEVRVSNTTNTTAVLSGIPYNVNISFVISAYNCRGESKPATLVINIAEQLNSATNFAIDQVTTHSFLRAHRATSTHLPSITPSNQGSNLLLISTSVASTAIIIVFLAACVIVAIFFVKQLRRKRLNIIAHDIELYTEVENAIPIYETIDKSDKGLNCSESISEADMSYVDMCGGVSLDPVYDTAEMKLDTANDVCAVDETLKSTKCCDLSNSGTHYQNVQEDKYSHYSKLPQHQQIAGSSIYND